MGIFPVLAIPHGEGKLAALATAATVFLSFVTMNLFALALPGLPQ